ncbi:MAG TPA: shikimate dehydrogenase [Nitrosopumilaceae archaeon]|nr:shikimate dehydrogenase [Nitrosopumilaceae archaeon]
MTKTFAVIGDPIDHSLSPNIHNAAFKELDLDCTYIAYRIPKEELEEGLESLKKIKISGFNVTIPHKIEIMKYLNKVDEDCSIIGASNTVSNNDGELKGHNTDMDGFLEPIKRKNITIEDVKVLLFGAGGAARAIVAGFAKEKAESITIVNRTKQNATSLSQFAHKIGIEANAMSLDELGNSISDYKFVINATSVGLKNEKTQIPTETINQNSVVYDIVYMPMNTDLIKKSKEQGATVIYGYEMLLGQATRSFEIWHGVKAPYDIMKKAILGGF